MPKRSKNRIPNGFDAAVLSEAIEDYKAMWSVADEELLRLCRRHPAHGDLGTVNAKLLIIGRAYATGIERKVRADGSQAGALKRIAALLAGHTIAKEIDGLIDSLPKTSNVITKRSVALALNAHGRMVELMREITLREQSPRSFVSKYLHFHRPVVPVYDSIVADAIPRLVRWTSELEVVPCSEYYDREYYRYVMRFWHLSQQVLAKPGTAPTVRQLDHYVLYVAERRRAAKVE